MADARYGAGPSYGGRGQNHRQTPPQRSRQSRSRSPGPYRHSRDPRAAGRPYSPPPKRDDAQHGKDEFGRDIRTDSASSGGQISQPSGIDPRRNDVPRASNAAGQPVTFTAQPVQMPPVVLTLAPVTTGTGLAAIDMTKFDFSSPESWQKLGEAWKMTHGQLPNQEQLMAYVMSGGTVQLPAATNAAPIISQSSQVTSNRGGYGGAGGMGRGTQQPGQQIQVYQSETQDRSQSYNPRGRGRGNFSSRGRGGYGNFNQNEDRQMNSWEGSGSQDGSGHGYGYGGADQSGGGSDAVILGGGEQNAGYTNQYNGGGGYYGDANANNNPAYMSDYQDYSQNAGYGYNQNQNQNQMINQNATIGSPSQTTPQPEVASDISQPSGGGSGGKMQRVGDRWVWQPAQQTS